MAKPKTQVSMMSESSVPKTNVVNQGKGSPAKQIFVAECSR